MKLSTRQFLLVFILVSAFLGFSSAQTTEATIKATCSAEWPSDFQMQAFCEGQQRKAVIDLDHLVSTSGGIPQDAFRTAFSGCVRDWPNDFSMQVFCLQQQIKGYQAVTATPAPALATASSAEQAQITAHCAAEWPTDFSMQAFCERQQHDGLAFLKTQPSPAVTACRLDWPNDYSMQAFCVRQTLGL